MPASEQTWATLGVNPEITKYLTRKGFNHPTPVQSAVIPQALTSPTRDILATARTGSGKTVAYVVPILQKWLSLPRALSSLVLCPTRELALQIYSVGRNLSQSLRGGSGQSPVWGLYVGGESLDTQFESMEMRPDMLVATPGRFLHLLVEMRLNLDWIGTIIFDEADRLLEMGFRTQLEEILGRLPSTRHSLLFSATLPSSVLSFARMGLENPYNVKLDDEHHLNPELTMRAFTVRSLEKPAALVYILQECIAIQSDIDTAIGKVIIFVATKHHVDYLKAILDEAGCRVAFIYGSLDQKARRHELQSFSSNQANILVVTDVAARGLDIPMVDHVIHYDFPPSARTFIHRTGRTARAGRSGQVWSLLEEDDLPYFCDLSAVLSPDELLHTSSIPREKMDHVNEYIITLTTSSHTIGNLREVMLRGDSLYRRSRHKASSHSYQQVKSLHHLHHNAASESSIARLQSRVNAVTPRDLKIRHTGRSTQASSTSRTRSTPENNFTDKTRQSHDFRDEAFFLPPRPGSHQEDMLHFDGEVASYRTDQTPQLPQKASQLKWKKRHQRKSEADSTAPTIRTEDGSKLPASFNSGRYATWKSKRKPRIHVH